MNKPKIIAHREQAGMHLKTRWQPLLAMEQHADGIDST